MNTSSVSRYWPYGSDGCQTHGFQGFVTALASIHFIAAIAWDRYHQYCTSELKPADMPAQYVRYYTLMHSPLCLTHMHVNQSFLILVSADLKRSAGQQVAF